MRKIVFIAFLLFGLSCLTSTAAFAAKELEKAIFAGGCFWCMEADFEKIPGVKDVISGYSGGTSKQPNYRNYSKSRHIEAVLITFDPDVISYAELLEIFWHNIDPLDKNGQFCDRGHEYSTAVFYLSAAQKQDAIESKNKLDKSGLLEQPVLTPILQAGIFFAAEKYHQNYYKKSSLKYKFYRFRCGRDQRLKELWGEKSKAADIFKKSSFFKKPGRNELQKTLTPLQFEVTQNDATEPPFKNKYWNNKQEGIYVDIVSGEPLFSSTDKYKSGTGWPSFTKPIEGTNLIHKEDKGWFSVRTELRSKNADSHLGHLFDDGPEPDGLRYCINSAALRFVAKNELEKEGYPAFKNLFQD